MWSGYGNLHVPVQNETLAFLLEGERRVISHCERLLAVEELPADDRNRLVRLRDAAAARLGQLTFAEAA
jgi:hypothetical protein